MFVPINEIRAGQVAEIRKRVPHRGHLPVQNTDHPGFSLVEDHIVNLVVTMHQGASVAGLCCLVGEEAHHVSKIWEFANGFFRIGVSCLGLCFGDCGECRNLSVVKTTGLAK